MSMQPGKSLILVTLLALATVSAPVRPLAAQEEENALTVEEEDASVLIASALDRVSSGSAELGIAELRRLGEIGYSEAFFHLAEIERMGAAVPANVPLATMYYRLAASLGNKRAALSLANLLFFEGDGSEANMQEAMALWQQYALKDSAEALYMLGMVYWNGEGGRLPDPIRGYGLVWKAAAKGYADAVSIESEMTEQLSDEARTRARQYASALNTEGFSDQPLALYMVMGKTGSMTDAPAGGVDITADAPSPNLTLANNQPADTAAQEVEPVDDTAVDTLDMQPVPAAATETVERTSAISASHDDAMEGHMLGDSPDEDDADQPPVTAVPDDQPIDWNTVWHVEVGVAMSEDEVIRLQKVIMSTQAEAIAGLRSEVTESMNRPGLYRLVYGPVRGLQGAVRRCVALKRAGYDCFARAPQ